MREGIKEEFLLCAVEARKLGRESCIESEAARSIKILCLEISETIQTRRQPLHAYIAQVVLPFDLAQVCGSDAVVPGITR
jgi:hypothetical protein